MWQGGHRAERKEDGEILGLHELPLQPQPPYSSPEEAASCCRTKGLVSRGGAGEEEEAVGRVALGTDAPLQIPA